jgi:hypothetical protein
VNAVQEIEGASIVALNHGNDGDVSLSVAYVSGFLELQKAGASALGISHRFGDAVQVYTDWEPADARARPADLIAGFQEMRARLRERYPGFFIPVQHVEGIAARHCSQRGLAQVVARAPNLDIGGSQDARARRSWCSDAIAPSCARAAGRARMRSV